MFYRIRENFLIAIRFPYKRLAKIDLFLNSTTREQFFMILFNMVMYQEKFQRSLDLFHQVIT